MTDVKGKGKGHPRTGHEGPEREMYSSTLQPQRYTVVGGQRHAPADLPWERPGNQCIGDWVGLRAELDECGKSFPHRDSIPGPSSQ